MGYGISGTPWHIEKLKMHEMDDARHKSRCYYYNPHSRRCFSTLSHYNGLLCGGSSRCNGYLEKKQADGTFAHTQSTVPSSSYKHLVNKIDAKDKKTSRVVVAVDLSKQYVGANHKFKGVSKKKIVAAAGATCLPKELLLRQLNQYYAQRSALLSQSKPNRIKRLEKSYISAGGRLEDIANYPFPQTSVVAKPVQVKAVSKPIIKPHFKAERTKRTPRTDELKGLANEAWKKDLLKAYTRIEQRTDD